MTEFYLSYFFSLDFFHGVSVVSDCASVQLKINDIPLAFMIYWHSAVTYTNIPLKKGHSR